MPSFRNVLIVCVLTACGSSGDDVTADSGTGSDATTDQKQNDSTTNDSPGDAPRDSPTDSPADSDPGDGGIVDAPVIDAPIVDSGVGCTSNNDCNKNNEYCEKGTNNCSGVGQCMAKPQFCQQIYKPVCGCDKQTHSNDCYAHAAGTSVWYLSPCE